MAKKSIPELKSYFETGDVPSEGQFADLIDSFHHKDNGVLVTGHSYDGDTGVFVLQFSDGTQETFTIPTDIDMSTVAGLIDALDGKVDKVIGKGLSTNDYDNTEKAQVAANKTHTEDDSIHVTPTDKSNWNNKVDQEAGKGLSSEDYTTAEQEIVAAAAVHHQNTDIHVTTTDKAQWNNRLKDWITGEDITSEMGTTLRVFENSIYQHKGDGLPYTTAATFDPDKWQFLCEIEKLEYISVTSSRFLTNSDSGKVLIVESAGVNLTVPLVPLKANFNVCIRPLTGYDASIVGEVPTGGEDPIEFHAVNGLGVAEDKMVTLGKMGTKYIVSP